MTRWQGDKMTGCHDDDMMTWHDDKMITWWEDNKMTRRQGEMITSWQDNKRARWQDKENNSSYSYFLTDMNELTPHVCAFEVGARGFNITKDNNNTTQILKEKKTSNSNNFSKTSLRRQWMPTSICLSVGRPNINPCEMQRYARATGVWAAPLLQWQQTLLYH